MYECSRFHFSLFQGRFLRRRQELFSHKLAEVGSEALTKMSGAGGDIGGAGGKQAGLGELFVFIWTMPMFPCLKNQREGQAGHGASL